MSTTPNICPDLSKNPWRYETKNNILAFYIGPLSQWYKREFSIEWDAMPPLLLKAVPFESPNTKFEEYSARCCDFHYEFEYQEDSKSKAIFNTAEQAMMFGKAIMFGDFRIAHEILVNSSPKIQKDLGRQVKNYDDVVWSKHRLDWVTFVNHHKFKQNEDLKNFLVDTCKNYIMCESSPIDRVWGIGFTEKDEQTYDIQQWNGQNLLGRALMRVREQLS